MSHVHGILHHQTSANVQSHRHSFSKKSCLHQHHVLPSLLLYDSLLKLMLLLSLLLPLVSLPPAESLSEVARQEGGGACS